MKVCHCFIVTLMILCFGMTADAKPPVEPYSSVPGEKELAFVSQWLGHLTRSGAVADESRYSPAIPMSFRCGDRSSADWVRVDNADIETGEWNNDTRLHTLRWKDEQSGLACEMQLTEYRDFPAMSWVVHLKNEGNADSANIHDFKALDFSWKRSDGTMPILYRSQGSDGRTDDFVFTGEEMRKSMWAHNRTVRMDYQANADFRRASNYSLFDSDTRPSATWLPFFNLKTGPDGLIVGIGWNGLWFAEIGHDGNGNCPISAGMQHLNTKLYPGESIRSPLMLVFYWSDEMMHGQNMFRRFVLKHFHPQENEKPVSLPVCCSTWGGTATKQHLSMIAKIAEKKLPYDYYWIDAGWYGKSETDCPNVFQGDWGTVGDWIVNRHRHPDTLLPISEAVKKANMKFLLWFEPIRTTFGTETTVAHPEWFLKNSETPQPGQNVLLDLGNPDARKHIVDTVSGLISENGIDCYREDFNIDPFPFWTWNEPADRVGMREMRFVEGTYAMWDELLNRHQGLLIDNCSSGGRRIELETMKRSVPLWRTDYNCFPYLVTEATQAHTFGISHWLPANAISPFLTGPDTYQCRSALSSGIVLSIEEVGNRPLPENEEEWSWQRERILEAKRVQPYFFGDFYPLSAGGHAMDTWLAYHFYLPEKEKGVIIAFRRPDSNVVSMNFDLLTVRPDCEYEFEDVDTGMTARLSGREIREGGYSLKTSGPRESRLVFYRRIAGTPKNN